MQALATDAVPGSWRNLAYPSLRPLGSWLQNLLARVQQLVEWTADLGVPKVVWLSGLFNPQSFLTAVMQVGALSRLRADTSASRVCCAAMATANCHVTPTASNPLGPAPPRPADHGPPQRLAPGQDGGADGGDQEAAGPDRCALSRWAALHGCLALPRRSFSSACYLPPASCSPDLRVC